MWAGPTGGQVKFVGCLLVVGGFAGVDKLVHLSLFRHADYVAIGFVRRLGGFPAGGFPWLFERGPPRVRARWVEHVGEVVAGELFLGGGEVGKD